MRNLDAPRQWQTLYDQPEAYTGGPIINDFERTWPFDWRKAGASRPTNASQPMQAPSSTPAVDPSIVTPFRLQLPSVYQVTPGDCCASFFWSNDSTEVRFIDQPSPTEPLGVWGVNVDQVGAMPHLVTQRLGVYNADRTLIVYPDQRLAVVERLADGQRWSIDTQGNSVSFTPGGQLMWTASDSDIPGRSRLTEVWLADFDGSNRRRLATLQRGSPVTWLSPNQLLVSSRVAQTEDQLLSTLSFKDGTLTKLIQLPNASDMTLSPDKRYLVYLSRFNTNPIKNGFWLLDLQAPVLIPQKLPFFGAYRWRDGGHLVYVSFDPDATGHAFLEYEVGSGQTRQLSPFGDVPVPNGQQDASLSITNNDWQISPDGRKIALATAKGVRLEGIWIIDLDPS
jgi:Tol biopolymer transport system component